MDQDQKFSCTFR